MNNSDLIGGYVNVSNMYDAMNVISIVVIKEHRTSPQLPTVAKQSTVP